MPKVSGLELLQHIKMNENFDKVPVVIFSSSTHQTDINKAYQLKVNSYIQKPKTFIELKDTMLIILNYWIKNNLS